MGKTISVIVAVYNVEGYLGKCITSIREQTYRDLEIILVDDGSSDGSGAICDKEAAEDSRIKVIHKENGGLSDARNAGLCAATGEYIGIVDADDWIHSRMYEIMLQKMTAEDADIVTCSFERDDTLFAEKEIVADDLSVESYSGTEAIINIDKTYAMAWNKLYKKEIFTGIRYPKGRLHEDEFVIHKLFYRSRKTVALNRQIPLYFYTSRKESIMANITEKEVTDLLDAFRERIGFAKEKELIGVIEGTVRKYCDICIDRYEYTKDKELKNRLWTEEKKMLKQNKDADLPRLYYRFAFFPAYYYLVKALKRMLKRPIHERG